MSSNLLLARSFSGGPTVFGVAFCVIVFLVVLAMRARTGRWPRGGIG